MGVWVSGRAVPWCLGRLPGAPGAPPGTPLRRGPPRQAAGSPHTRRTFGSLAGMAWTYRGVPYSGGSTNK